MCNKELIYPNQNVPFRLIVGKKNSVPPEISIAIPTYKRPSLLFDTIKSVLNQKKYDDFEIVVIDNDSDQEFDIESVIRKFNDDRVLYYRNEENIGGFSNWNRCFELAKGEWISILNDDDYLSEDFILNWKKIKNKIKVDYYFFGVFMIGSFRKSKDRILFKIIREFFKKIIRFNENDRELKKIDFLSKSYGHGTLAVVMNRKKAISVGGFDNTFYPISDHAFWINSLNSGCSIYRSRIKLGFCRVGHNSSLEKNTIWGFVKKFDSVARLVFNHNGQKCGFLKQILIKNLSGFSSWRLYRRGSLSKDEFKDLGVSVLSCMTVTTLFYFFYSFYKIHLYWKKTK